MKINLKKDKMKTIRKYFIAHYFIRRENGKFLIMEGAFIYMLFACIVLTYGVLYHFNSLRIIPFILPFAFGVWQFLQKGIKDIEDLYPHWRTQLRLLKDPRMNQVFNTDYDKHLEAELAEKWFATYGENYKDLTFVKLQKWQPLALPIIAIIIVLLYS